MAILLQNDHSTRIPLTPLRQAASRLLREEGPGRAAVSVLLTSDRVLLGLNQRYRGINRPTDVLSFSQQEQQEGVPPMPRLPYQPVELGDVVISVDTAARQAELYDRPLQQELCLLTVHGILHLLGYEDETDEGAAKMRRRERELGVRNDTEEMYLSNGTDAG